MSVRLLVILVVAGMAKAVLALDPMRASQNLAPITEYYTDSSGQLTYSQVKQLPDDVWTRSGNSNFNFGFTSKTYWFRTSVSNNTHALQRLVLEIGTPRIDHIDVFISTGDGQERFSAGITQPFEARAFKHRNHVFPFHLSPKDTAQVLIRAQSATSMAFPLTLWHENKFIENDRNTSLFYGIVFGIWLVILIYNTVFYAAVLHNALASFVAFVFSYGVYELATLGLGSNFVWSRYPDIYDLTLIVSLSCALLALMQFANNLLDLRTTNPYGLRVLQVFTMPVLACVAVYPVFDAAAIIPVVAALSAPAALTVIFLGVHSAVKGNRLGLYSTMAWTPLLIGMIADSMVQFQLLPLNFMTENAAPAGFVLMMLTLSFFIAAEYRRQTRIQQEQVLASNLQFTREQREINAQLEEMVHDRTMELENALEELSKANETLKEINTMDAVTGIKNRHYFDTIFDQEWKRACREKYPISLLLLDIDHFKNVNDEYGHLAGDECLREVATTIHTLLKRPADIVARYGGEEFVAVLPYIENQNALDFANKIRNRVESTAYLVDGHEIAVTVSIGVCTVTPEDDDDLKDVIAAADIALYEAKNAGRNQVRNAGQLTVHTGNVAS